MIFLIALLGWFLLATILFKAAEWSPGLFLVCYHVLLFIAALKITETFF